MRNSSPKTEEWFWP